MCCLPAGAISPEPAPEIVQHRMPPPQQQSTYSQHQQQIARQHQMQMPQRQMDHNVNKVPVNQTSRVTVNADSPYSSRQNATSTLVYSSQPNAMGINVLFVLLFCLLLNVFFLDLLKSRRLCGVLLGNR